MGLTSIAIEFPDEEACIELLARLRWPNGVRCASPDYCNSHRVSRFTTRKSTRKIRSPNGDVSVVSVPPRYLYECMVCGYQFSVTTGTAFHKTHLPLRKWFFAIALILNEGNGISARQLKRDLNVSHKAGWFLLRRIREAVVVDDSPSGDDAHVEVGPRVY